MIQSSSIANGCRIAVLIGASAALFATTGLASTPDDRTQILSVLRLFEEGDRERAGVWSDATLRLSGGPRRLWREVPSSELNQHSRIEQHQISVRGNRTTAYVAVSYRLYAGLHYTGERGLIYDYHVLHRRQGEWGIFSTTRRVIKLSNSAKRPVR